MELAEPSRKVREQVNPVKAGPQFGDVTTSQCREPALRPPGKGRGSFPVFGRCLADYDAPTPVGAGLKFHKVLRPGILHALALLAASICWDTHAPWRSGPLHLGFEVGAPYYALLAHYSLTPGSQFPVIGHTDPNRTSASTQELRHVCCADVGSVFCVCAHVHVCV